MQSSVKLERKQLDEECNVYDLQIVNQTQDSSFKIEINTLYESHIKVFLLTLSYSSGIIQGILK